MKKTITTTLLALMLTACGGVQAGSETAKAELTPESVQAAIDAADAKRAEADSMGNEWRWTSKHIDEAKTALAEGKLDEAMAKAERARKEGELAVEQANKFAETAKLAQP